MASAPTTTDAGIERKRSTHPCRIAIRRATAQDEPLVPGLCALLQDAVHGGASVGFLAPLALSTALRYWRQVFQNLEHDQVLWFAQIDDQIVGTVQLGLCNKENGRHRAEVQKLLVLKSHRGHGIASALLKVVDDYTNANKLGLLYLDTIAGSDGEIRATAVYYKRVITV